MMYDARCVRHCTVDEWVKCDILFKVYVDVEHLDCLVYHLVCGPKHGPLRGTGIWVTRLCTTCTWITTWADTWTTTWPWLQQHVPHDWSWTTWTATWTTTWPCVQQHVPCDGSWLLGKLTKSSRNPKNPKNPTKDKEVAVKTMVFAKSGCIFMIWVFRKIRKIRQKSKKML